MALKILMRARVLSLSVALAFGSGGSLAGMQSAVAQVSAEQQSAAQSIIDQQISAFRARDHEKAYGFAAPHLQKMFGSTDRFIGMVRSGYGAIYGARQWSFGRSKVVGQTIMQEVRLTGPNGVDWVALYTMREQPDGSWKIAGVQMKKADALST